MGLNSSRLTLEDRVVARCDDGLLQAEHALFKPREGDPRASDPGEARYATTAGEARARLDAAGVTLAIAEEAAAALRPEVVNAYALGEVVRTLAPRLGPYELFEGKKYDPVRQSYSGSWIDLHALAADLGIAGAGLALQALHLASAIAEVESEAKIVLVVEGPSQKRQDRAFQRVPSDYAKKLLAALRALKPADQRGRTDNADELRIEIGTLLRDRALSKPTEPTRKRLEVLEHALAQLDVPARGPLAAVELWAIERQLASNDARGVDEKLDALERAKGKTPATRYLREHAAFVKGSEPPRRIAERLSHWMRPGSPFYELDLLKARAWLAAGMPGYARHYARGLVEDRAAPDAVCLVALEILEATSQRARTQPPPSGMAGSIRTAPIVVLGRGSQPADDEVAARSSGRQSSLGDADPTVIHAMPRAPESGAPPPLRERMPSRPPRPSPSQPSRDEVDGRARAPRPSPSQPAREELVATPAVPPVREMRVGESTVAMVHAPRTLPHMPAGGSRPPYMTEAPPMTERMAELVVPQAPRLPHEARVRPEVIREVVTEPPPEVMPGGSTALVAQPRKQRIERYIPENVEQLPLPVGLSEGMLAAGVVPRTPDEARIACTRMSRELARDYRLWHGTRLQTNAIAIESMQRHLLSRWPDGRLEGDDAQWELRRHGALLSEILARVLGGYWVDVKPTEIGYWAMVVPPGTRTWPFGRIVRFISMGHREKDLVSYYLELVARSRVP